MRTMMDAVIKYRRVQEALQNRGSRAVITWRPPGLRLISTLTFADLHAQALSLSLVRWRSWSKR